MPSLAGARTRLGLAGTPSGIFFAPIIAKNASDTWSASLSESVSIGGVNPRPYVHDFTRLGLSGTPSRLYGSFAGRTEQALAEIVVSDTWLTSFNEDPVDENFIESSDTWRASVSDSSLLHNRIDVVDSFPVSINETVSLLQAGVTLKTASDTWSASLAESLDIAVTLDVTDNLAIGCNDAAVTDTTIESITASDSWSASLSDEEVILEVFTGLVDISALDQWVSSVAETAFVGRGESSRILRFKLPRQIQRYKVH